MLEPDSEEVLRLIRGRLEVGQHEYGRLDIDTDPRDWTGEGLEEALDLSVYLAIGLIRLRRLQARANQKGD